MNGKNCLVSEDVYFLYAVNNAPVYERKSVYNSLNIILALYVFPL